MKIGNQVKIVNHFIPALVGCTGTIVEEELPSAQMAMLCGKTSWKVRFDSPVTLLGETLMEAVIRENSLTVIQERR